MDGSATVRLLPSAFPAAAEDTPAIRRIAPRNFSVIFMIFFFGVARAPSPVRFHSKSSLIRVFLTSASEVRLYQDMPSGMPWK